MQPRIPSFSFDSPLTEAVFELERLRGDLALSDTDPELLRQIREVLQLVTSMTSARIEGNRTTVLDVVKEKAASGDGRYSESVQEVINLEQASQFIDAQLVVGQPMTQSFLREMHRIVVEGLRAEGDRTPGTYRRRAVAIAGAALDPPGPELVPALMTELVDFINEPRPSSHDLIATAIAHHRFLWIHPFTNGNGRVARLLTYASLVSQGFTNTMSVRAINPTAVFGADRERYYDALAAADSDDDRGLLDWCAYVLVGLKQDLSRMKSLGEAAFVLDEIIRPSVEALLQSALVSAPEAAALRETGARGIVRAGDLSDALPGSAATRSQAIRRLLERRLLEKMPDSPRAYRLCLTSGPLVVAVIRRLEELDFIPAIMRGAI